MLDEIRHIAKSLINTLPNKSNDGPLGKVMDNTKNTQYFTEKFPDQAARKLNDLLASFEEANGVEVSDVTKEKALSITRSLLENYGRSILRGTSSEMIPDYGEEE